MRILILTQWYPPEPQKLLSDLAQSLQLLGHNVTVLTGFPNYPLGRLYPGYRLKLWQREDLDGVPVVRVPLYPDHSRSAFKRAANFISFAISAAILGPCLTPQADIIYVIHPPVTIGWPAWLLSRLKRIPFVYEIKDMWPETLRASGLMSNTLALGVVGWFAKWIYDRAASICVVSSGFRANLTEKGVPTDKIHVISNWVDTNFYRPLEPDPELATRVGLAGRFNVMYAGAIGLVQGIDTILDAASLLRDVLDIQFVLVGDGVELPRLQEDAKTRGLSNVRFLGRYPADAMPGLYALADVLLIHLSDDPLFRITIPHKTFTYLASAKPVLAAIEGDAAEVIRTARAGLTCQPSNPQSLADAVRRFYTMPPAERKSFGENGRRAACNLYSRDYLVGKVAQVLEGIIKDRRTGGEPGAPKMSRNKRS
jgi:glycosyltransferase involved in cell wall biosynthesis